MEEVEEVAGPHLVDRGEQQIGLPGNEAVLHRLGPARVGRGDVIDRRQALLVRPGDVDVGKILPLVGGRLLDLGFFGAGDGDDVMVDDELAQAFQLDPRRLDRAPLGLVGVHLVHARGHGRTRGIAAAGVAQQRLVRGKVGTPDPLELADRHVDHLGIGEHPPEPRRAKLEIGA